MTKWPVMNNKDYNMKKKNLASKEKPILKTVTTLAEERGLDPAQLEKEALEHGFGVTVSGVLTIDETLYDVWVTSKIRDPQKKKTSPQKKLGDSDSIGNLRANVTRLTNFLQKDEDSLRWLDEDISTKPEGIERKMAQKKRMELQQKIDRKHELIGKAEKRLHFILDRELEDTEKSIFEDPSEEEMESLKKPKDENPTIDQ